MDLYFRKALLIELLSVLRSIIFIVWFFTTGFIIKQRKVSETFKLIKYLTYSIMTISVIMLAEVFISYSYLEGYVGKMAEKYPEQPIR